MQSPGANKLILKAKKFQLSNAKRFGSGGKPPEGVDSTPPTYHLGLNHLSTYCINVPKSSKSIYFPANPPMVKPFQLTYLAPPL